MLNKLQTIRENKKDQSGFTIIEVMIVLAIAGLIILIVLLAVPALQRNGRNTAIKNDASAIAAAVSEYKSNNDGKLPTAASVTNGVVTVGASGTNTATGKVQVGTTVNFVTAAAGFTTPAAADGVITVISGAKCGPSTTDAAVVSARSVTVIYSIETGSSSFGRACIDA